MFPANAREALLVQLQTELAVEELTMFCYELWLPRAEDAAVPTLTAAMEDDIPPDPPAIGETSPAWEWVLDAVLMYGLSLITGWTTSEGFEDLTGQPLDESEEPDPEVPPAVPLPAGMPGLDELRERARDIVSRRMSFDADAFAERLRRLPQIRELQSEYLADVRNRMVDTPDTVFREISAEVDEGLAQGESPDDMRARVQRKLDASTSDWENRAVTVARTESAGAQSAATVQAAELRNTVLEEENLQQVWIATIDGKTRRAHFSADGQRVPLGSTFSVGRDELRYPGDPRGSAENVINCRCRVAVLSEDEPLPSESDRQTERGPGDSTVRNREGSREDEIERRADDGVIRARDDPDGVGIAASGTTMADERIEMPTFRSFTADLAVIGQPTDDGRMFAQDISLDFRAFPLPLMWQRQASGGHFDSYTVGVIESAEVTGDRVTGSGYLLNTAEADEAAAQIEHGVTGPSVDLGDVDWEFRDADGTPLDIDVLFDDPDTQVYETVLSGRVLGATLVSIPAFEHTSITLGGPVERGTDDTEESLVASLGLAPPAEHPPEFFTDPEFSGPTLPHMTADGRVLGHLATFDTCHVGIRDRCVKAPRSQTGYAWFHTAPPVKTSDGNHVAVGRLTVGGGHASSRAGAAGAVEHYDNVGTCFALVHVGEDEYGIWFSGVPAPGVSDEQLAAGLAAPLSGDWRMVGGSMELVAALAVNTPGFPIVAGASDQDDRPLSLVASLGPCRETGNGPQLTEQQLRVFGRTVVAEMKAAERREARTRELIGEIRRREVAALIAEV